MNKITKPKLIILSDLWGKEKSDWLTFYTSILETQFDVSYYDCCELGGVDKTEYSAKKLHQQFIDGGIEKAVDKLLELEKGNCFVLGFSVGGTIAWKACLSGLKAQYIFAISSTGLRHETLKPTGVIELIYGEKDANNPKSAWFEKLDIKAKFYKGERHELYRKKCYADEICEMILKSL